MYNPTQAMLIICTRNSDKSAAAVHNYLNRDGCRANIRSQTSTKHGKLFVLNILFEIELGALLELEATYEAALGDLAHASKPLLVSVDDAPASDYDNGYLGVLDCYANDAPGLAAKLTNVINPHADIYQLVCYSTEAPMQGSPLFVAHLKLHVATGASKERLQQDLQYLGADGWDISANFQELPPMDVRQPLGERRRCGRRHKVPKVA